MKTVKFDSRRIQRFRRKLLNWYAANKRQLPWRETKDPYHVLVSETMLQQTQVSRVVPKYTLFLRKFPTVETLAKADTKTLLSLWSGLGFNSRALRLRDAAVMLVKQHNGIVPDEYQKLKALPGVGDYTASAVLSFAFNKRIPVIDTNIRRVLISELALPEDIGIEELKALALRLIPKGKSCQWHNALMDYGALHATSRKTGIRPLSRQSKFEGSARQVRGKIVKHILASGIISHRKIKEKFPRKDIGEIIDGMLRDGLIARTKRSYYIP